MFTTKIEFQIPEGKVPKGADPEGFITRLSKELQAYESSTEGLEIKDFERKPAPKEVAGISEIIIWSIEHREHIKRGLEILFAILVTISRLVKAYMKKKKRKMEQSQKTPVPSVKITVAEINIFLPANHKEIDDFMQKISKNLLSKKGD